MYLPRTAEKEIVQLSENFKEIPHSSPVFMTWTTLNTH